MSFLSLYAYMSWLSYRRLLSSGVSESQYRSSSIVSYNITSIILIHLSNNIIY